MSGIHEEFGGPAFPIQSAPFAQMPGMTLRDYFAARAMASLIIEPRTLMGEVPLSVRAYEIADAMLYARAAPTKAAPLAQETP